MASIQEKVKLTEFFNEQKLKAIPFNNGEQWNVYGHIGDMYTYYPSSGCIVTRYQGKLISRDGDLNKLMRLINDDDYLEEWVYGTDDGQQTTLF